MGDYMNSILKPLKSGLLVGLFTTLIFASAFKLGMVALDRWPDISIVAIKILIGLAAVVMVALRGHALRLYKPQILHRGIDYEFDTQGAEISFCALKKDISSEPAKPPQNSSGCIYSLMWMVAFFSLLWMIPLVVIRLKLSPGQYVEAAQLAVLLLSVGCSTLHYLLNPKKYKSKSFTHLVSYFGAIIAVPPFVVGILFWSYSHAQPQPGERQIAIGRPSTIALCGTWLGYWVRSPPHWGAGTARPWVGVLKKCQAGYHKGVVSPAADHRSAPGTVDNYVVGFWMQICWVPGRVPSETTPAALSQATPGTVVIVGGGVGCRIVASEWRVGGLSEMPTQDTLICGRHNDRWADT